MAKTDVKLALQPSGKKKPWNRVRVEISVSSPDEWLRLPVQSLQSRMVRTGGQVRQPITEFFGFRAGKSMTSAWAMAELPCHFYVERKVWLTKRDDFYDTMAPFRHAGRVELRVTRLLA